ncbi:MAG: Acyl transferase [Pseudonocardiales bacterium]|nr:Acyl transferase [Pseudonocardiales bacterium]
MHGRPVLAVLAPGQGSQTPGMLAPWLERPGARETVERWSALTGLDLIRLGTTADAEEIKDTAITQPLIVVAGLLAAGELGLLGDSGREFFVAAGHSIGEVTAAAIAGVLSPDDAVVLAARRGAAMAEACNAVPTSMSAVLGGDADTVVAAIEALGLTAANRNAAGQIVAAGAIDALAALAADPPAGARVRPLAVAGAFHTSYMAPAQSVLAEVAATMPVQDASHALLSNFDGRAITDGGEFVARLVAQVTTSVRWDLCQQTLRDIGVDTVIELAPAGTLVGLAKREMPGVTLLAIKSPADIEAARSLLSKATASAQGGHTPDLQIIVSPAKGVFTRADGIDEGSPIIGGAVLGTVRTNGQSHDLLAPFSGVLDEWVRHDGDIVGAGLPLARVSTDAVAAESAS